MTPLIASTLIFVLFAGGASISPWVNRPWMRLGLTILCLGALTLALAPLTGSEFKPHFASDDAAAAFFEKLLVAAWWLLLARSTIAGGKLLLGINRQHHSARLLSDLVAGVVYLGGVLAVLDLDFDVSVTGLMATSGVIAIVLGLALQNSLGDLFSGIAIGIDRPFNIGDLIAIEGAVEGRVVETNWRSTRIATADNDIATVPNSVVAKSRIVNRSIPSETHTGSLKIVIDPSVPPRKAIALLRASALNAASISSSPAFTVTCTDLTGKGAAYEICFSAPALLFADARSDLLQQVARHARYGGVALASQDGTPIVPVQKPEAIHLLSDVLVMQPLGAEDRKALASSLQRHEGAAGDSIFTQGGSVASLFVIGQGAFEVTRDDGGGARRLGTLGPGDYFGEMALLTGAKNSATVTALTHFFAYEVTKEMIAPLLERNPDLLLSLEQAAGKAQVLLERAIATQACPGSVSGSHMVDRIRAFFRIDAAPGRPSGRADVPRTASLHR
jgi:small-conductance mechanosensitive channel/CRP-like cAMP-binding protein